MRSKYEEPWSSPYAMKSLASTKASVTDFLSPRSPSLAPAALQEGRHGSPLKPLYSPSFPAEPDFRAVLAVIARQGELDVHVEETKALLPNNLPIETIFGILDRYRKGHVT